MRRALLISAIATTALLAAGAPACAQADAYPDRPIRVIFPYPAGSAPDVVGRLVVEKASRILGQPMVFDNRPGANGILASTAAARASADGYTIYLTTTSALLINQFLRKDLSYDPVKSFKPIIAVAELPVGLMISSRIPASNLGEFISYAKGKPGEPYASIGIGSFNHLLMEQFRTVAGLDMLHVPYQGAAPVISELMGGRVNVTVLSVGSVLGQMKAGQVKVLAFMTKKRLPSHPDVPTVSEVFPSFRPFDNWMGFLAPAQTPDHVVQKLNAAFKQALQHPDVRKKIDEEHWRVLGGNPADLAELIEKDPPAIAAAVKAAGVKPE
jgi:tripartite-type tricarboxylate transporter receptor subunit TctC